MGILNIDTSDPDLLKKKSFDPVPTGKYVCIVENNLKVEPSKSSDNSIVKIELRISDDGQYKGRKIFDNLVIGSTPEARKKSEWKIAQFAVACGVCTKETLNEIDLDLFRGSTVEVDVGCKTEKYKGEDMTKNYVKAYLFEADAE